MSVRVTVAAGLIGLAGVAASTATHPLLIWNATASAPIGLYALRPAEPLHVGELVVVAPPPALARSLAVGGYLPLGVPLLKPIAALPGQQVCRTGRVICIDGAVRAQAVAHDYRGRPLPVWRGCHRLAAGEVFLMNAGRWNSLDGRYFGPLPSAVITARAVPLWTRRSP